MKLLVTGGTTFVSKFTAEYFAQTGHEVTVLNRGTRPQPKGCTAIIADRAQAGDYLKNRHFDAVLDVTAYTKEHVQALLQSGVTFDDYVFVSSSAVYVNTNSMPMSEEMPCGRNAVWGDYGWNKLLAEQALQAQCPQVYILRPPYFYGIYENLYREAFPFDCAMQDRPFYLPQDGEMRLQFFHVEDLCRFMEVLLKKHPQQRVFNVGNPETVSVRDWITLCYWAAGKNPRFVSVDKGVPQREYFCFYDYEYALDVSRMTALLPVVKPLEQGLTEEFAWYRNHPESVYYRKPYLDFIDKNLGF